jgi:hypothetical protein
VIGVHSISATHNISSRPQIQLWNSSTYEHDAQFPGMGTFIFKGTLYEDFYAGHVNNLRATGPESSMPQLVN